MRQIVRMCAVVLSVLLSVSMACGCNALEKSGTEINETQSVLYVSTRDAGMGYNWLEKLARDFEEKYKNEPFEEGKVGVQVVNTANRNNSGEGLINSLAQSQDSVLIIEDINYSDYSTKGLLYDISDLMQEELDDGSGTVLSKLDDNMKSFLSATDGHYYSTPYFAGIEGITYNAQLFEDRNLYFADESGYKPAVKSSYTNQNYTGRGFVTGSNKKKSPGPDGKYDTFDDGLPSSYEEFFYMLDQMYRNGIDGIIYTGASKHYLNYLFQALICAYSGAEELNGLFDFDTGSKTVNVITSFNGNEPVVEQKAITEENGYLVKQTEAIYCALKFLEHLFKNESSYFYGDSSLTSTTNLDAQTYFVESACGSDVYHIGMLIEGDYWYNEAETARNSCAEEYGVTDPNVKFMSLPGKEKGTVNENEGKVTAVADGLYHYIVVNANIKGKPVTERLAKLFYKFCFEDANLETVNRLSGIPLAVDYELSTDSYNELDTYKKSVWDLFKTAKDAGEYVSSVSGSQVFLKKFKQFKLSTAGDFYYSTIGGIPYETPRAVFNLPQNNTARDFFQGMWIAPDKWISEYLG